LKTLGDFNLENTIGCRNAFELWSKNVRNEQVTPCSWYDKAGLQAEFYHSRRSI